MNQDERRARQALESGEVRRALEQRGIQSTVVGIIVDWTIAGMQAKGGGR